MVDFLKPDLLKLQQSLLAPKLVIETLLGCLMCVGLSRGCGYNLRFRPRPTVVLAERYFCSGDHSGRMRFATLGQAVLLIDFEWWNVGVDQLLSFVVHLLLFLVLNLISWLRVGLFQLYTCVWVI